MKIEELLKEVKIRFGEDWENAEIVSGTQLSVGVNVGDYEPKISPTTIWNANGKIYRKGEWATAKITEAPEKWVVEKDEDNPIWGEFRKHYKHFAYPCLEGNYICNKGVMDDGILYFENYQYLTLEQWKHFFGKPKVGDVCILRNVGRWIIRPYIETDELVVDQAIKIDTSKTLDEIIKEFGL